MTSRRRPLFFSIWSRNEIPNPRHVHTLAELAGFGVPAPLPRDDFCEYSRLRARSFANQAPTELA